jgi:hypothetical protein
MLRRLGLSVAMLVALGLGTVAGAAAQGYGGGQEMGPGMGMAGGQGMGPGMGMPGMGPGMGMPGGQGMGMPGTGPMGPFAGMGGGTLPPSARTDHPGDNGWGAPCPGCRMLVELCEEIAVCIHLPRGFHPPAIGLHPHVVQANVPLYFPEGPLACAARRLAGPAVCVTIIGGDDWARSQTVSDMGHGAMEHDGAAPAPGGAGPSR